jgi:hypothetical protein
MSVLGIDNLLGLDSLLGGPGDLGGWGCSLGDARTLAQFPSPGVFRRWLCAYTSECAEGLAAINTIANAFGLDGASGEQLDLIGAWIDLPRQGIVSDDRYRTWLKIQAALLSGLDVGKSANILAITRLFLGSTVDPIILTNGQYAYTLDFPDFDTDRAELLARCRDLGVERLVVLGVHQANWQRVWDLVQSEDNLYAAFGLHPIGQIGPPRAHRL